jgi:hypothetical protein
VGRQKPQCTQGSVGEEGLMASQCAGSGGARRG